MSGRWISTENAIKHLQDLEKLPLSGIPSISSINALIASKQLLEVTHSYEVLHCREPFELNVADTSGSLVFRTVDFADDPVIETCPANDANELKNHPNNGRKQLYLFALVDAHSGYLMAEYKAMNAPNSWAMAEFLLSSWKKSCTPRHFCSDGGAEFSSSVNNLITALGINRIRTRPRNPRGRGIVERAFRTLFGSFESNFILGRGAGQRLLLSDLNKELQQFLQSSYNERPCRIPPAGSSMATSGCLSRYERASQSFGLRTVPDSMSVPQLITRVSVPVGRGCVRFLGSLWTPREGKLPTGVPVQFLASGDEVLAFLGEDGGKIPAMSYECRTGLEFTSPGPINSVPPSLLHALIACGIDERHLKEEVGQAAFSRIMEESKTKSSHEVQALIRNVL